MPKSALSRNTSIGFGYLFRDSQKEVRRSDSALSVNQLFKFSDFDCDEK
jgi:hypothetical protein